jgi:adenosylmethionine-8-amino-7-oxononanoate aminotransferase
VSESIFRTIAGGSGAFLHGHTYMGHATACAAALAVQKAIVARDLLVNVRRQGALLDAALRERFGNHRHVGDIRGRGLFLGMEIVADRGSKAPFPAERRTHARVKREAFTRGLLVYPGGGSGGSGDNVLIAPPYIVTESDIGEIVSRLGDAVDAAVSPDT